LGGIHASSGQPQAPQTAPFSTGSPGSLPDPEYVVALLSPSEYQNNVLQYEKDDITSNKTIQIKEPGTTEIKIWDKKSGQIADRIWVQVE
jgi:hypothetical protein